MKMSQSTFVLLGIAYYIFTIVTIVIVLNLLNKKDKKKYQKEISELERDKNLIISAAVVSELNKVEPLVNNADMQELFQEWQRRFKEMRDLEVPKITDQLIEIEELFQEKKYKE